MNFYIKQVKLWFNRDFEPQIYSFKPDKVNVITGDSSTGKSSILRIIDYCLLSDNSMIVENVINENIRYYGLSFHLDTKDYIIVRNAPGIETNENDVFFYAGNTFPDRIVFNMYRADALLKLNELFHYNALTYILDRKQKRTNFRHMLLFNYLTEDIIGTLNNYFDKRFFDDLSYEKNADMLFKQAIGMDEIGEVAQKNKLEKAEKLLNSNINRIKKNQKELDEYNKQLRSISDKARQNGIVLDNSYDVLRQTKSLKERIEQLTGQMENDRTAIDSAIRKDEEMMETIKNKLIPFDSVIKSRSRYKDKLSKMEDSLKPLDFMKEHFSEMLLWDESKRLYDSLSQTMKDIKLEKDNYINLPDLPDKFMNEYYQLKERYLTIKNHRDRLIANKNEVISVPKLKAIWTFYYDLIRLKRPNDELPTEADITNLEDIIKSEKLRYEEKIASNSRAINVLNMFIYNYYQAAHGISDTYNSCIPKFNPEHQTLELFKPNSKMPIKNIGSKSNYMFLHLCFFLGMHEMIVEAGNELPSFLFIDQPSIPYYERKKNNEKETFLPTDDSEKLKSAFLLINMFMDKIQLKNNHFQIILVEHADSSYWANLNHFETRYEFNDGIGLIPKSIHGGV